MTQPAESPSPPNGDSEPPQVLRQLSGQIFSVSAGLVGVCLTVIGFFRLISRLKNLDSVADNLLAIDAFLFLASCMLAYLALRSRSPATAQRLERAADGIFLVGLTAMVVIAGLVAYELI